MKYWIAGMFILAASLLAAEDQKAKTQFPPEIVPPLGLPAVPWPADNPYTVEKAELGRLLYYDKRLSADGSVSCASCHNLPCGYSDCRMIAIGIDGNKGTRHSPTVINSAYLKLLFWDGRAASLEEQCMGPVANTKEMASLMNPHEAHQECAKRINEIPGYKVLFKKIFGTDQVTMDNIAKAISTFERTILSGNSPYDKYRAGDAQALTPQQLRGWELFKEHKCSNCHAGADFSDGNFYNIGVGMDAKDPDTGRYAITHYPSSWGTFKVPTLREIANSGPYMHDGSLHTLREVIEYYDKGGIPNKNLHPLMKPLKLSEEDKTDLVHFLMSLCGEGWQHATEPKEFPQ